MEKTSSPRNKEIEIKCNRIIKEAMSWSESVKELKINDGNLQRVYIRYIINIIGYDGAKMLLSSEPYPTG